MYFDTADTYKDELTQVYNRKFLELTIPRELKKVKRYGTHFSLLLLDIDDFSFVNKLYGHKVGDKVLASFSQFLRRNLRDTDTIIRMSGDEFLVVLPYTSIKNAKRAAERIIEALREEDFHGIKITVSMGIVEVPTHGAEWDLLYSKLDTALFKAKKLGHGVIYTLPEIDSAFPIIPSPSLIGRVKEKSTLLQKLEDKNVKIICISGATGVGKTRLVEEALKLNNSGIILTSKSSGSLTSIPFYPFRSFFKSLKAHNYFLFIEALERLDEGEKIALSLLDPEIGFIPEHIDRYKFFDAYSKILDYVSKDCSVILFIDDFHWIDTSSMELLYFLIHSNLPNVKIIVAYRIEGIEGKPLETFIAQLLRERIISEILLENLSERETNDLAEAILQGKCDHELKKILYTKTGGNPFFVEEVIKDFFKRDIIVFQDNEWIIEEESTKPGLLIPETIECIIKEKIKPFEGNPLLEYAACLGPEFDVKVLQLCTNKSPGEIYDVVDKLVRNNVILEKGLDIFSFKEDITREIILSKISETKRRFIHKNILEAIEKISKKIPMGYVLLSYHAYKAGELEKVKVYTLEAARELKRNFGYLDSLKHYKWYLEAENDEDKKRQAFIEYIDTLSYLGEIDRGIKELMEYLQKSQPDASIYYRVADFLSKAGDFEEAHKYIDKAITMENIPKFKLRKAWIYILEGAHLEAEKILKDLEKAKKSLQEKDRADFENYLALTLLNRKEFKQAEEHFMNALEIRTRLNDPRGVANIHLNLGNLYDEIGLIDKAISECEKAQETYSKIGDKRGILAAINNKSENLLKLGEYDLAIEGFKETLRLAKQIGDKGSQIMALVNCAEVLIYCGIFEDAEKYLTGAMEIAIETKSEILKAYVQISLLRLYLLYKQNKEKVEEIYRSLKENFTKLQNTDYFSYLVTSLAEASIHLHDLDYAKNLLENHRETLGKETNQKIKITYYTLLLTVKTLTNENGEIPDSFKKLSEIKKRVNRTPSLTFYYENLARYLLYTGRKKKALRFLEKILQKREIKAFTKDIERLKRIKTEIFGDSHVGK